MKVSSSTVTGCSGQGMHAFAGLGVECAVTDRDDEAGLWALFAGLWEDDAGGGGLFWLVAFDEEFVVEGLDADACFGCHFLISNERV